MEQLKPDKPVLLLVDLSSPGLACEGRDCVLPIEPPLLAVSAFSLAMAACIACCLASDTDTHSLFGGIAHAVDTFSTDVWRCAAQASSHQPACPWQQQKRACSADKMQVMSDKQHGCAVCNARHAQHRRMLLRHFKADRAKVAVGHRPLEGIHKSMG